MPVALLTSGSGGTQEDVGSGSNGRALCRAGENRRWIVKGRAGRSMPTAAGELAAPPAGRPHGESCGAACEFLAEHGCGDGRRHTGLDSEITQGPGNGEPWPVSRETGYVDHLPDFVRRRVMARPDGGCDDCAATELGDQHRHEERRATVLRLASTGREHGWPQPGEGTSVGGTIRVACPAW